MKPAAVPVLLLFSVAALLSPASARPRFALPAFQQPPAQDPATPPATRPATEPEVPPEKLARWARDLCGPRWNIRRQAGKLLLGAGDAGLDALAALVGAEGRSVLGPEALAVLGDFGRDRSRDLLRACEADADFVWRPQALEALIGLGLDADRERYERALGTHSFLYRRAGLRGLHALDGVKLHPRLHELCADPDPNMQVEAAGLLLDRSLLAGVPLLVEALEAEDPCFGKDLAVPLRQRAWKALEPWLVKLRDEGRAGDFAAASAYRPLGDPEARRKAREAVEAIARKRIGEGYVLRPEDRLGRVEGDWKLGFERSSCNDGDLVLRVDAEGRVWLGAWRPRRIEVPAAALATLRERAAALDPPAVPPLPPGACEALRLGGLGPEGARTLRVALRPLSAEIRPVAEAFEALVPTRAEDPGKE